MHDLRLAGRYALEGARLLRRRPSLLLVALAFGAWNGLDASLLSYVAHHRTAWGAMEARHLEESQRQLAAHRTASVGRARPRASMAAAFPRFTWCLALSPRGPSLGATGALTLAWAVTVGRIATGDRGPYQPFAHPWLSLLYFVISGALPFVVGLLTLGGYLGVLGGALQSGDACWFAFASEGRRYFWRLLGYSAVVGLWSLPATFFLVLFGFGRRPYVGAGLALVLAAVTILPLALTGVVIVWDDARRRVAMRTSRRLVRRHLLTALALIVGPGLLQWLVWQPYVAAVNRLQSPTAHAALLPASLTMTAACLAISALGACFCAAALCWYRDARERTQPAPASG